MNKTQIRRYSPVIYSALGCNHPDKQNVMLGNLSDPAFDFMCDCLNKVVYHPSSLNLTPNNLSKLKKLLESDQKDILYLAKKGGNRNKKRKIIIQQRGSGIGVALATVLPFLVNTVRSLFKRKKK